MEEVKERNKNLNSEINTLKSDLDDLKNNIDNMPRKTWLRSVGGSVIKFAEKVVLHESIGKTILGTTIKALLPDIDIPGEGLPKISEGE